MNIHLIIFVFVIWIKYIHTADATREVEYNTKWLVDNFLRESNDRNSPKIYLLGWGSFGRKVPQLLPDFELELPDLFGKSGTVKGNKKHKKYIKLRHKHCKNHRKIKGPKPLKPPNRPKPSKPTKSPQSDSGSGQDHLKFQIVDERAPTTDEDRID